MDALTAELLGIMTPFLKHDHIIYHHAGNVPASHARLLQP